MARAAAVVLNLLLLLAQGARADRGHQAYDTVLAVATNHFQKGVAGASELEARSAAQGHNESRAVPAQQANPLDPKSMAFTQLLANASSGPGCCARSTCWKITGIAIDAAIATAGTLAAVHSWDQLQATVGREDAIIIGIAGPALAWCKVAYNIADTCKCSCPFKQGVRVAPGPDLEAALPGAKPGDSVPEDPLQC